MEGELDIEVLERLGSFTKSIRSRVADIPKEGVNISEIINFIEKEIFDNGYLPAFPATVSLNEVAAHYTIFEEGYVLKKGDLIKIDFGVLSNGFITDNAFTMEIGSNNHDDLLKANFEGLNKALEIANVGCSVTDIGKSVDLIAKKNGFNTIHNLSGHQICVNNLHCGLSIPNYANGDNSKINDNMEIAIEPFFTYGVPKVKSVGGGNILHLKNLKPIRDPIAKKLLQYIKEFYPVLPFSKRWLVKEFVSKIRSGRVVDLAFDKRKVLYALRILKTNGIIIEYDILETVDGSFVSQFEDTVVFINNKKSIITRV